MNKKTFTFASFLTAFGILFLGSFYAWVISQFNQAKFFTKISYYFNKNFPNYELEVSNIDFKVSNKLRYRMENFSVRSKTSGNILLKAPELTLDIPVGAFLGNREIRLKTKGLQVNFKNSKKLKSVFFADQEKETTIQLDLPQLIDRNKVSFKATDLQLKINDSDSKTVFEKVFFKNLNMSHYTAFEIDGGVQDGSYRLYGEIDLGNFLKSRNIKMESYLTFKDFNETRGYLNDLTFKVMTSPAPESYIFKLTGLSDNAKGDILISADSQKLVIRLDDFITTEKLVKDHLYIDKYYTCSKSENTNIDGTLSFHYEQDIWKPNLTYLGDCIQVTHRIKKGNALSYLWDLKFIDEQGIDLRYEVKDFLFNLKSLENVKLTKEYLEFSNKHNLTDLKNRLPGLFKIIQGVEDIGFPIQIIVKKIDIDKISYNLKAEGTVALDGLTFEDIILRKESTAKAKGSLIYFYPENKTNYNFDLKKSPARVLETLLDAPGINLKGLISKGRISQQFEEDNIEKAFDMTITNGEFEWVNLLELLNKNIIDASDKNFSKLLIEKKFKRLSLMGTNINGDLKINWKYSPATKNRYQRSGQLNFIQGSKQYSFSTMFEKPSKKLKKYILNKFGSDQISFKLEKDEDFKIVQ